MQNTLKVCSHISTENLCPQCGKGFGEIALLSTQMAFWDQEKLENMVFNAAIVATGSKYI